MTVRSLSVPFVGRVPTAAIGIAVLGLGGIGLIVASRLLNASNAAEAGFGALMAALALIIVLARIAGAIVARLGQPRVMGEVLAGILLGPTLVGGLPNLITKAMGVVGHDQAEFAAHLQTSLVGVAEVGLIFYMFLVGLELDPKLLTGRVRNAAAISLAGVILPFALGLGVGLTLIPPDLIPQDKFIPFAIFMGVAMSITAFPVLARILIERRMIGHPVGALTLAAASIDDVLAWGLLAIASAIAASGVSLLALAGVMLAAILSGLVLFIGRPVLRRLATAYEEAGTIPAGWVVTIFLSVITIAFLAQQAGVAAIFGAFIAGLAMPRRADLTHDISRRIEEFVVIVMLPVFFVIAGSKADLRMIVQRQDLWGLTALLLFVAIAGKWLGTMLVARAGGFAWRPAAAVGALMNTRGLTELIVLNLGAQLGLITAPMFSMLLVMALVTTFMAGPALRLIDPKKKLTTRPQDALAAEKTHGPEIAGAPAVSEAERPQSILVAPLGSGNLPGLISLAEGLANSTPKRELILARLSTPSALRTGRLDTEQELASAARMLNRTRDELVSRGLSVRTVALASGDVGEDLIDLAGDSQVDLLLVDGRRPILGEGIPTGVVGQVLREAECDVAVLIERSDVPDIGPERPVVVPFGGGDHDWSALEIGAWIASSKGAPLRIMGVRSDEARDPSRLLTGTSVVVQQLTGVGVETMIVDPGVTGAIEASTGAGLMVIGLSERWREEGLGDFRAAIAQAALAPILFVRRGSRPGVLAAPDGATRFRWSVVTPPPGAPRPG
jgi:Kef-type K+ transport system membrane component KefB